MKFFLLLFSLNSFACFKTVLNRCKSDGSLHSISKDRQIKRYVNTDFKQENLLKVTSSLSAKDLVRRYKEGEVFNKNIKICQSKKIARNCYKFALRVMIQSLYKQKLVDELSVLLFYNDLIVEKKDRLSLPDLKSYSSKVRALNKKNKQVSKNTCFSCSIKGYKVGKIKGLNLDEYVMLKYSYLQLAVLNKTLVNYSKRITSLKAGFFFDYENDGEFDEVIELDPSEATRLSIKLLRLELEKLSYKGEILNGVKVNTLELLAVSSNFMNLDEEILKEIFSGPYLKDKRKPIWKKVLSVTRRIGESVLLIIPGVNVYAALPIVLLNAYEDFRKEQNENSDLHIVTF